MQRGHIGGVHGIFGRDGVDQRRLCLAHRLHRLQVAAADGCKQGVFLLAPLLCKRFLILGFSAHFVNQPAAEFLVLRLRHSLFVFPSIRTDKAERIRRGSQCVREGFKHHPINITGIGNSPLKNKQPPIFVKALSCVFPVGKFIGHNIDAEAL